MTNILLNPNAAKKYYGDFASLNFPEEMRRCGWRCAMAALMHFIWLLSLTLIELPTVPLTALPAIRKVTTMAKTLYIIDGHAHIYAAYYAPMRQQLTSPAGEPTKAKPRIWLAVLIFLLPMGCTTPAKKTHAPGANKRPAVPNPISSNEYEFGVIRSLSRSAWSKKEFSFFVRYPVHFQRAILYRNNRLAFDGSGGIRNSGLCWWHSRLTRSATYLTVYLPDLPKPTKEQVLEIFDAWVHNSRVVEVPGYKNLRELSRDWRYLLRKKLERWQLVEGVVRFGWIRGLRGETEVSSEELKDKMDKLFEKVRIKNEIVYQKLQTPGIAVHSWLVVDMKKTSDGYILRIIDSTSGGWFSPPPVNDVRYRIGDRYIRYRFHNFVPYTEFENELEEIRAAQLRYCRSK